MATSFGGNFYLVQQRNKGYAITGAFSPTNIAGLVLWLDGSDGATITQSGGSISQWNDKSGLSHNATKATGSAQPTVQTAAQNSLNTVRFTAASSQFMGISSISLASGYTAISVIRRGGPTGTNRVELAGGNSVLCVQEWYSDTAIYAYLPNNYIYSTNQASTAYNQVTTQFISGVTGSLIRFNGSSIYSSSTVYTVTESAIVNVGYGGSNYCNGEIGEFCIYDHATHVPTLSEIQSCEAYLKSKWATP